MLQCARRYTEKYFDSWSLHVIIVYKIPTPEVFMLVIGKYVGKVECVKGNIKNIQSKTFNSWEKLGICFRLDMEVADSTLRWIKSKYKHATAKLSRIILQD